MKVRIKHRFFSPTDWAPIVAVVLLIAVASFGLIRLYSHGQDVCNSLTVQERNALSLSVDVNEPDYEHNMRERSDSIYGCVSTADGKVLFNVVDPTTMDTAFGSLLGSINDIGVDDTRYILNHYQDALWPEVQWNVHTGITAGRRAVELTLNSAVQEAVLKKMTDENILGSVTAYDYTTGDVFCLASTPIFGSGFEGSYINKCLYSTTPGSTQKLVTLLLLTSQGYDPSQMYFTCDGSYTLPDGAKITCTGIHGHISGIAAIGQSCNCWFAQAIRQLDMEQAKETLRTLGFRVNGEGSESSIGKLPISPSSVELGDTWDFHSIWSLIGQDSALTSPLQMVTLAGNYVTGGNAALPRLTTDEVLTSYDYSGTLCSAFKQAHRIWKEGFTYYYPVQSYGMFSQAKTGTADGLGIEHNETHKLLCAVSEEYHTVIYVVNENYLENNMMPCEIASFTLNAIKELCK